MRLSWFAILPIWCFLYPQVHSSDCDWDYTNPNYDWPRLPNCPQTCSGPSQSPINISSYLPSPDLSPLRFSGYSSGTFTLINQEHTLEVDMPDGYQGSFEAGYNLIQYHFHTPAENTLKGVQYPFSMHLVHKNPQLSPAGLKVLTFLFEIVESPENPWLVPLVEKIPLVQNFTILREVPVSMGGVDGVLRDLQGRGLDGYVRFSGSLTTPPCTEGVDWFVMLEPLSLSRRQFEAFRAVMGANARPVQRDLQGVRAFVREASGRVEGGSVGEKGVDFWVVLGLLILVSLGLVGTLVYLKKKLSSSPPDDGDVNLPNYISSVQ